MHYCGRKVVNSFVYSDENWMDERALQTKKKNQQIVGTKNGAFCFGHNPLQLIGCF